MTDCINAARNQQEIPTPTHTHTLSQTHKHIYSVFDQPTLTHPARSPATASCPPWQTFTEAGPGGRGASARKGLHIKGSVCSVWGCGFWCLFSNTFCFLNFLVVKPFLVVTSASSYLCFVSNLSALLLCGRGLLLHSLLCFCSVAPWNFPKG